MATFNRRNYISTRTHLRRGLLAPSLRWIGYFSSTAVYGDCGGDWIDETRGSAPRSRDARARLDAEEEWREIARARGAAFDILRIAGIYGPGRDRLASLREGEAQVFDKPGQVFNRIHRDDIAGATLAAMRAPTDAEAGYTLFATRTAWDSEAAFIAWTESEAFRASHGKSGTGALLTGPHLSFEGFAVVRGA